jgi:CRP-like cAMP-binding protein
MYEVFEKYLKENTDLTEAERQHIQSLAVHKKIRKRQFLLQEGDVSNHKYFVLSGCLRSYRVKEDGTEHILKFATENWWIGDMESYNHQTPSRMNIDALEDGEVLLWSRHNFDALLKAIPAWNAFRDNLLARSLDAGENRIFTAISFTAEEKYRHFLATYPDVAQRVPLHLIASYLGVSRETLTRIRKANLGQ